MGEPNESPAAIVNITGQIGGSGFRQFAASFARRLDLSGHILHQSDDRFEVRLQGAAELIDMFEIACWLGPADARVDMIDCQIDTEREAIKGNIKVLA